MEEQNECYYCENSYASKEQKDAHEKVCEYNVKTPSQRFKEKLGKAYRK